MNKRKRDKSTEPRIEREVTREMIIVAIETLERVVRDWETSTDEQLFVNFRGRLTRTISIQIENAASELFSLCDTKNVSKNAWPLVLAIDSFDEEFTAFADRFQIAPDDTDPNGGSKLWLAFRNVVGAKTPPKKHKIEPIPQLLAEKVDRRQIAKIYGWYREDGTSPDLDKLQEEITAPGTHYDPKTFVHPKDHKFWADVEKRWSKRVADFDNPAVINKRSKKKAIETLDELILQGVNLDQIVKMKSIDREQVRQRAAAMGVALDGASVTYSTYHDAQRAIASNRQAGIQSAMQVNTHADMGIDRQGRITAMLVDGHTPKVVFDSLKPSFPDLSIQEVMSVLDPQDQLATL